MFWTLIKNGLTQAVLVLAAMAFVLVPTADATVCGAEPASAQAALISADLDGHPASAPTSDDSADPECDACLHGHCHNQGHAVPPLVGEPQAVVSRTSVTGLFVAERAPPGVALSLPQRPPRG